MQELGTMNDGGSCLMGLFEFHGLPEETAVEWWPDPAKTPTTPGGLITGGVMRTSTVGMSTPHRDVCVNAFLQRDVVGH